MRIIIITATILFLTPSPVSDPAAVNVTISAPQTEEKSFTKQREKEEMGESTEEKHFTAPLKIPMLLSGNFGEIRSGHFHSGIDIRTRGVTGHKVVAAASGYIYRISVSPVGFGKALYIRHPFGYSTVYAHLESFTAEVESYVRSQQYRQQSYSVNLFPPAGRFRVEKGKKIALSGNTGSSMGPHLHFEVRESEGEIPVDPLGYLEGIKDDIAPIIERIAIYPATSTATVNGRNESVVIPAAGGSGEYTITGDTTLVVSGTIGFGIGLYDLLNDSPNRCGVKSIELYIDDNLRYRFLMERFSFAETRYVNSHTDFKRRVRDNITIQQLFVAPNDRLSLYRDVTERGLYTFNSDRRHNIRIVAKDSHGNSSVVNFDLRACPDSEIPFNKQELRGELLHYGISHEFTCDGFQFTIPNNALYDSVRFLWQRVPGDKELLSDLFRIHNRYTPLHRPARLAIRPDTTRGIDPEKMVIVAVNEDNSLSYAGGSMEEGYLVASIQALGDYSVYFDTIPPVVTCDQFYDGADLRGRQEMSFTIRDELSGIGSYNGYINGEWALFAYDAKNNRLTYRFDRERIERGSAHFLALIVEDNSGNRTTVEGTFLW